MQVEKLLLKTRSGQFPLMPVQRFEVDTTGIIGGAATSPLRQVLILPQEVITAFHLKPGDLRENIITKGIDVHQLASGTVLKIGEVRIRLTYHCEPCKKIKDCVELKSILHQRGYFGTFLNEGAIAVGDPVVITDEKWPPIPYAIKERIQWFLDQQQAPVSIKVLIHGIGLAPAYARAIPNMMKGMSAAHQALVLFSKKQPKKTPALFEN